MNLEQLHNKLLATARANPPSDRVPYAFEKRIMARIAAAPGMDVSALWANTLWRMVMPCVALVLLVGAISAFNPASTPSGDTTVTKVAETEDFSQHFETTLMAAVNESEEGQ